MNEGKEKASEKRNLKEYYSNLYPLYQRLCEEVRFILEHELENSQIKIHGITYRIKTFDSLYQKIIRKQASAKVLAGIHDIAGIRVVCLYRSDLEIINNLISQNFRIVSMDTSRNRSATQFGYMADHYIVKLSKECKGKRYDEIKSLECEIQVRTVLMDAWSSVSHHLDYKKEVDIPSKLRKDFNAVSGLLYAADTHFELFREGIAESKAQLMESIRSDKFDMAQEINLDSLSAYLKWQFPDRERLSVTTYSDLLSDLNRLGYTKIADLNELIQKAGQRANDLEKEEMNEKFYSDTGFTRICLMIGNDKFFEETKRLHFKKNAPLFKLIEAARKRSKKSRNT